MRWRRLWNVLPIKLLGIGLLALVLSAVVQRRVEEERVASNLIWTDPENKQALEAGFLALGGFRGVLADMLWVQALRHQEHEQYYELKLLCDVIQELQPTFIQVHAFQAHNMAYNLAGHAQSPEDRWYWIRSGLATLEKGLARNKHHYALWFELAFTYFDRLGPIKIGDCKKLEAEQLPRLDDLSEDQRITVFSGPRSYPLGRARPDENYRYAAYFFYKALETQTQVKPLSTERMFGQSLMHLGQYNSVRKPERNWDDWGAEDWWLELLRRNEGRGIPPQYSEVPINLRTTMCQQLHIHDRRAHREQDAVKMCEELSTRDAAWVRYQKYFPEDTRSLDEVLTEYRGFLAKHPGRDRVQ